MKDTNRRLVVVAIEASHMYCSNSCPYMVQKPFPLSGQRCSLFDKPMEWDTSRATDGNYRLDQCQRMEMPVPP